MTINQLLKIGQILRAKRAIIKKSIREMAKDSGISRTTLQKWEDRPPEKPRKDIAREIAKAYGVSEADLMVKEEDETPYNVKQPEEPMDKSPIIHENLHEMFREIKVLNEKFENMQDRVTFLEKKLRAKGKTQAKR